VSALPFFIRDELVLDPSCFFHKSDFMHLVDGKWDKEKRTYLSKTMLNQEQYLSELEDCFRLNRPYLPEVIITDTTSNNGDMAKHIAMAHGEDEVSVISNLTDKTLKAATSISGKTPRSRDDNSTISGNTSKSKTQLAVKEALKEVSVEHNRAMTEQQQKFQQEIDALRKALEHNTRVSMEDPVTATSHPNAKQTGDTVQVEDVLEDSSSEEIDYPPQATNVNTSTTRSSTEEQMIEDSDNSSDDELVLQRARLHFRNIAKKHTLSPIGPKD
jgi:hypothetical protein